MANALIDTLFKFGFISGLLLLLFVWAWVGAWCEGDEDPVQIDRVHHIPEDSENKPADSEDSESSLESPEEVETKSKGHMKLEDIFDEL